MAQWWSFIKADNAQAYYIMNMSTGQALYSSSGEVKTAALDKSNSAFMWDLELVDVHEYKISVHNSNPVSYTHLDVYKRQTMMCGIL